MATKEALDRNRNDATITKKAHRCFVISPFNARGDFFFRRYVAEACNRARFTPDRADRQLCEDIAQGVVTSLGVDPVVIAYLESPPWNTNVVLELGYRMATRMPLVIVCDEPSGDDSIDLPFQLSTKRVITIPTDEDVDESTYDEKVEQIVDRMRVEIKSSVPFDSNQAVAIIHAPLGPLKADEALYVAATHRATELFGVDGQLVGRTLEQFVADRRRDMPNYQFEAFVWEQARLEVRADPKGPTVIATTPIVFSTGKAKAKAFLPIIVNYHEVGSIQEIMVLYLDVTSVVKYVQHNLLDEVSYYVSLLNPQKKHIPSFVEPVIPSANTDGVFLAHNKADAERVRVVYELLKKHGGDPWFDEVCIPPGSNWLESIEKGIGCCRAAFVFVGKNGYGAFQDKIEARNLLITMMERERMPLIPVLMDGLKTPPGLLRGFQAISIEQASDEQWISEWVETELPKAKLSPKG